MSDAGLTTDAAPPVEVWHDHGPVTSAPAAGEPPAGSTSPAGDLLDTPVPDQYDRGYVEQIRRDAAKYRVEAQTAAQNAARYDEVFGQYEPTDQEVWFDLARTWSSDPVQGPIRAAQIMKTIAEGVLAEMNGYQPGVDDRAASTAPVFEDSELTTEKVQALIDAQFQTREQAAAEQRAVDDVMSEVRAAGYDPNTAEGFMVLWNANHETGGDISKAAEMVKGYRQSVIDEYVQGRTSGRAAPPIGGGVQATSAPAEITNLEDARRATDAFLKERMAQR